MFGRPSPYPPVTQLTHAESGQWQSALMVMPLPKADPQGYGSALTYGRRYSLSALLGIVTEEDDDGVAAGAEQGQRPRRKRSAASSLEPTGNCTATGNAPGAAPDSPRPLSEHSAAYPADHPALSAMPRLDGINYSVTTTQDGKTCIIASGNTNSKKQILSQAGFKYSEQRKIWWRYAEAA